MVAALRGALDAVLITVPLDRIAETIGNAIKNKNPSVKEETCLAFSRAIQALTEEPPKSAVKLLTPLLAAECMNSAAPVRDAAITAMAAVMKAAGERAIAASINSMDAARATKIRNECAAMSAPPSRVKVPASEKMAVAVKAAKTSRPKTASAKSSDAALKKKPKSIPKARLSTQYDVTVADPTFPNNDNAEAAEPVVPGTVQAALSSTLWKEKVEALDGLLSSMDSINVVEPAVAVAVFSLIKAKTKDWKDTNFQVMSKSFQVRACPIARAATACCD